MRDIVFAAPMTHCFPAVMASAPCNTCEAHSLEASSHGERAVEEFFDAATASSKGSCYGLCFDASTRNHLLARSVPGSRRWWGTAFWAFSTPVFLCLWWVKRGCSLGCVSPNKRVVPYQKGGWVGEAGYVLFVGGVIVSHVTPAHAHTRNRAHIFLQDTTVADV